MNISLSRVCLNPISKYRKNLEMGQQASLVAVSERFCAI